MLQRGQNRLIGKSSDLRLVLLKGQTSRPWFLGFMSWRSSKLVHPFLAELTGVPSIYTIIFGAIKLCIVCRQKGTEMTAGIHVCRIYAVPVMMRPQHYRFLVSSIASTHAVFSVLSFTFTVPFLCATSVQQITHCR